MNQQDKVAVDIPKDLAEKIEERIKGTDFDSVASYVIYILKQIMSTLEEKDREKNKGKSGEKVIDEDKKKVEERLKKLEALGYLD